MTPDDDEIVDAEIIDDDSDMLPVHVSRETPSPLGAVVDAYQELPGNVRHALEALGSAGPDTFLVAMDREMQATIMEALGWFWTNGPRHRSTVEVQRVMTKLSDALPRTADVRCRRCGGTGLWRDRLGKEMPCNCPAILTRGGEGR